MARRGVATAFADIRADLTRFDADLNQARARLVARMRELDQIALVHVRADVAGLDAALRQAQAEAERVGATDPTVHVGTDAEEATAELRAVQAEAEALAGSTGVIHVSTDALAAEAELRAVQAEAEALAGSTGVIHVSTDAPAAVAELRTVQTEAERISALDPIIVVLAEIADALAALTRVEVEARAVGASDPIVHVRVAGAATSIAELSAVRERVASLIGAETLTSLAAGAAKITAVVGGLGLVISGFALRATGQMEKIKVAFSGILGPVSGQSFLNELKQFAAVTPFQLTQVTDAAQQLLAAFGPDARRQILPTLSTIGDIVSVTGGGAQQIDRVTLALTQMQGKGKVATQELNQLREALPGFNAIEPIAKALGITVPEAMKAVEARTVSANVAIDAILQGMREYPGAAGAMERQSQTLIGRLSTLKDVARFAAIDGFGSLNTAAKTTLESVVSAFTSGSLQAPFRALSDSLGSLLSTLVPGIINSIGPLSTGFAAIIGPLADALKVMIPLAVQLVPVLGELIGTLIQAIPLDLVVLLFDGLATGIAALNSVLQAFGKEGVGAILAFTGALVALVSAGPLTAVIAGITVLGALLEAFNGGQREIQRNIDNVAAALGRQVDKLLTSKDALNQLANSTKLTVQELVKASTLEGLGKGADGLEKTFGRLGLSMGALVPIITAIRQKGALKVEDLTDPAAIAAFGQLQERMGLTRDQLDSLFKVIENGSFDALRQGVGGNVSKMQELQRQSGLSRTQLEDLVAVTKAGGTAFLNQASDLETLVTTIDRLPTEKAISEFLAQNSAVTVGGVAFLNAALHGRTLEAATKDMSTAQATLAFYLGLVGDSARHSGADFVDFGDRLNNVTTVTSKQVEAAKLAADAFDGLATPVKRLADESKAAQEALTALTGTKFDLQIARADFADSLGVSDAAKAIDDLTSTADRLSDSIQRARDQFDLLSGKKLNLADAQIAMEKLLNDTKAFAGTSLDLHTEEGLKNLDSLSTRIRQARDLATSVFDTTGDPAKAAESYANSVARIGTQFVNAGGDLDALNRALDDLNIQPIDFNVAIDQTSREALFADIDKITATNPEVAVSIAALVDAGHLDVANAALDALKNSKDQGPRIAEIDATVVDADTARKALEDLAALPATVLSGFNVATAAGNKNARDLVERLKAVQTQSLGVLATTGSISQANDDYATSLATIRDEFAKNGTSADEFDAKVRELSADPINFQVVLDETHKAKLLDEVSKFEELNPRIAATITTAINQGQYDVAAAALDALKRDKTQQPRIAAIVAEVHDAATAQRALDELAKIIAPPVIPTLSDADVRNALSALDPLNQTIRPPIVPTFSAANTKKFQDDLAAALGFDLPVRVHPIFGPVGWNVPSASGNFFRSFKAGGFAGSTPVGRNIREMASTFTPGARNQFMWGEPSTHGEFFLSMAPEWRDRNKQLHEQAGRMLYGPEYTVNAQGLEAAVDKLSRVVHAITPGDRRLARAESGQRVLQMAKGAVTITAPKPELAGRALIDELTRAGM